MRQYLLTAAGKDQPGLVASVSKILFQEGCNLEDSAMTRLQGEFAILLIFSGPVKIENLRKKLSVLGKRLKLSVQLKPLTQRESQPTPSRGDRVLVSVYGADRPGIVHRVTDLLAKANVNLSDLSTHRTEAKGNPSGYIVYVEGETAGRTTPSSLEKILRTHLTEMGVTVSVKLLSSQAL